MSYYTYNTQTNELVSWYLNRDDIIDADGIAVMDCPDNQPDLNQKLVNGSLVVDEDKVRSSLENDVRSERDTLLLRTDWWATADRTMTAEQTAYRQALRDIPDQAGFPTDITWPTKPEVTQ